MNKVATQFLAASVATVIFAAGCGKSMNPAPQSVTSTTQASKPPVVLSATQSSSLAPNRSVFVKFNRDMDAASITSESVSIAGVSGSVRYDTKNRIVYLTPASQLSASTTYNASVAQSVRDMNGMNLASKFNFAFTTTDAVDTTPPTVISVDSGCIGASGPIHVTFSEAMDSSTINGSTFIVNGVLGTVSYDPVTHIASFTPSSPLTAGATYNVTITSGVTDLAGNHLGARGNYGGQDFTFTVTVCSTPPPPQNFCSYSKGGYHGTGAPGQLLDNNYTTVFSEGLTIGINDAGGSQHDNFWTGDSTGLAALKTYFTSPAGGGSGAITVDATNPTATDSGNLGPQTAALTANIGLSGVSGNPAGFGDLVLHDTGGSLDGSTVSEILAAANNALAGNGLPSGYSFDDLNALVANIDLSWDDCVQSEWAKAHLSVQSD